MNKKIITIGILILFLISLNPICLSININLIEENKEINTEILNYIFEQPTFEKIQIGETTYDKIVIDGCDYAGNSGEPNLPARGAYILLPQNSKITDIEISYKNKVYVGNGFFVEPVAENIPLSMINVSSEVVPNEEIYSSDEQFPGRLYTEVGTYGFRGYDILVLKLHPVQYKPRSGKLFYYQDISISVETNQKEKMEGLYRNSIKDKTAISNIVDNPNLLNLYQESVIHSMTSANYDMVIITKNEFVSVFEPLSQRHNDDGLKTFIKTTGEIYNEYSGIDSAEKVRNFVRDAYLNLGIDYVLLGGDYDIIPAKLFFWESLPPFNVTTTPSDQYYSCLDGTFNYDCDEIFGESDDGYNGGDVDLFAEVSVGRACVSDIQEVINFVTKTIDYLNTDFDDSYLQKVLLAGEFLDFQEENSWGGDALDQLVDFKNSDAQKTYGIPSYFYYIDKLYDRDWPGFDENVPDGTGWQKQDIIDRINENIHVINHLGHSDYDYNMRIMYDDIYSLHNEKPIFVYSQGCMAGSFDKPEYDDCIAEYFTVKTSYGAFAGIWNGRNGVGYKNTLNGPSQRYNREFWDAVFGEKIFEIGRANQDSKEDNIWRISDSSMRGVLYGLNLFGDPSIALKVKSNNNINNQKPNTPSTPTGVTSGISGLEYSFNTTATDPDGDQISYGWDWDGDCIVDEWTKHYRSGEQITTSHKWNKGGTYNIRVKSIDTRYKKSSFSNPLTIIIEQNDPPNEPIVNGPTSVETGIQYNFTVELIDPNDDNLYFHYRWVLHDSIFCDWQGQYLSGEIINITKTFEKNEIGNLWLLVQAKDEHNLEGATNEFKIIVSKGKSTKTIQFPLIQKILNYFPFLEQLFHFNKLIGSR